MRKKSASYGHHISCCQGTGKRKLVPASVKRNGENHDERYSKAPGARDHGQEEHPPLF